MTKISKPLVLMILDGWGMKEGGPNDALSLACLPNFDRLWRDYPHTQLEASGLGVGLPPGQMGNSEVGHMNIGAGRVVYQDFTRISMAIEDGSFFANPALRAACSAAKKNGGALHLLGLVSDGGVHSHLDHVLALLRLAKLEGVEQVYIHCFTDGRDTAVDMAAGYAAYLEQACAELGVGRIATVCGRFYAMDRDKRWQRVEKAYHALVNGAGHAFPTAAAAISDSYSRGIYDEFIEPAVMTDQTGSPIGRIRSGDSLIFFNFRSDRMRQICHAFADEDFMAFERGEQPPQCFIATMTAYDDTLKDAAVAFAPAYPEQTLGQILSRHGLKQLRLAETEKYAHVTFFFNGGVERLEPGEERILIPSPKVRTYDLQPEMSAATVTEALLGAVQSGQYDVIVVNYANPDMVGHTGVREAIIRAVSYVDQCLGQAVAAVQAAGGAILLTADHGNAERICEKGEPMTAHTTNKVPFILIDEQRRDLTLHEGSLEDIAPTMLHLLNIDKPAVMTGNCLIDGCKPN
ncbi:MAG: 2,3-bisphosphoglycerate-independent phosphoglycerate mutase [Clostridia bacterium]|nr:2,3-bisphosphoglycerate-independent phosphoglycerate mutase [Clostridia bacterium]